MQDPRAGVTPTRHIGYAKLGRSLLLDPKKWGPVGGDNEPLAMLLTLAARYPDVEWVLAGRHGGDPGNLPANVTVPTLPRGAGSEEEASRVVASLYDDLDGAVVWLGQHGTSNSPIPQHNDPTKLTSPQISMQRYAGPIIRGLNAQDGRIEPVWLCADVRNYLKARDLKWYPSDGAPVLGQYEWARAQRHYRYGDPRAPHDVGRAHRSQLIDNGQWESTHEYVYSGLELTGVPEIWSLTGTPPWEDRVRFGIIINENRSYVALDRASIVRDWVRPLQPDFIHGKWSPEGQSTAGMEIDTIHYLDLQHVFGFAKSTFTTPASGSRWATAKPWEAFELGVVCFFHPQYDDQGHIVPTRQQALEIARGEREGEEWLATLALWLRPETPEDLWARVNAVDADADTYAWLVEHQSRLLHRARDRDLAYKLITEQLGLDYRGEPS